MKKISLLLLILLLAMSMPCAHADGLNVQSFAGGFSYECKANEEFLILSWKTDMESGQCTIFSENGTFSGNIELLHTFTASPFTVSVKTLDQQSLFTFAGETIEIEQAIQEQNLPEAKQSRKLTDVQITPLVCAMQYHFQATGHPSLLLKYRSSTEKGTVVLYAGDDYTFDGILALPYTYNNSNVVLTVANSKDTRDLYEIMLRTDYPVTEAPAQGTGRLNGITVCIDPGHQETAKFVTESRGPGLSGSKETGVGMARGVETRRMESIVVLEIGFMLRDALLAEGATVVMTRETQDTYISNIRRAEIATEAKADFFLRMHCDYRDSQSPQGIGIFCPYGSAYAKAIGNKDQWNTMAGIMLSAMQGTTGQSKGNTTTTNQYVGNNWATMPSFLIEMGYMSNPVEDVLLSAKPYQQRLVDGMVNAIAELSAYRGLITEP